jgi:hypothetical protein
MGNKPQINKNTKRLIISIGLIALVLITITGCAQATESELASAVANQPAAVEATPKPAGPAATSKPSGPTSDPDATLAPIEARPTRSPNDPTPTAVRPTPTPSSPSNNPTPTENPAPVSPTATTTAAAPNATSTSALQATAVPNATSVTAPTATPTPLPTAIPMPTPRPTPGPITRQTQFVPLDEPAYVTRENASTNIKNDSYVLGVASNGEARAYPLDMMWYHHIANDTVGGEPWLVTY